MSRPEFTVEYRESRSRRSVALRIFLAIPHLIIYQAWQQLAQVLAFIQWWIILVTGRRHEEIWKMQAAWLNYGTRVNAYTTLMYDPWPNIGPEPRDEPVRFSVVYEERANRWSNALRILWIIPAVIVAVVLAIGVVFGTIVAWFAVLITGRHPRRLFDFVNRFLGYMVQVDAWLLLMSDDYPRYRPTGR